jgi:hypothetical protein
MEEHLIRDLRPSEDCVCTGQPVYERLAGQDRRPSGRPASSRFIVPEVMANHFGELQGVVILQDEQNQ